MYCILYVPYLLYTSYYLTLPLTPESKSASISGNNFMVLSMEVSKGSNLFRDPRNWRNSEEALVPHHFPQTNHWNIGMCKPNYAEKSLFQTHFNTHTHRNIIFLWEILPTEGNTYLSLRSQTCFEPCAAWLSGSMSPQLGDGDVTKVRAAFVWLFDCWWAVGGL